MADNNEGFAKLKGAYGEFESGETSLPDFIDRFETICFNDLSSNSIDNFSDGWSKASVSTLLKVFLKAMEGNESAMRRLRIDLHLENVNMEIKRI